MGNTDWTNKSKLRIQMKEDHRDESTERVLYIEGTIGGTCKIKQAIISRNSEKKIRRMSEQCKYPNQETTKGKLNLNNGLRKILRLI